MEEDSCIERFEGQEWTGNTRRCAQSNWMESRAQQLELENSNELELEWRVT